MKIQADKDNIPEIVRQARLLNPGPRILPRCNPLRGIAALRRAGADPGNARLGLFIPSSLPRLCHRRSRKNLSEGREHRDA